MENSDKKTMNADAPAFNINKSWTPGNFTAPQPAPTSNTQFSSSAPSFTPTAQPKPWSPAAFTPNQQMGNFQPPPPQPANQWSQLANATTNGSTFNPGAPSFNGNQNRGSGQPWQPQAQGFNPNQYNQPMGQGGFQPNQGFNQQQPMYNQMQGGQQWQNNKPYRGKPYHGGQGGHKQWDQNRQYQHKPKHGGYHNNYDNSQQYANTPYRDFGDANKTQPGTFKFDNQQMQQPLPGSKNFDQTAQNNASIPAWKQALQFTKKGTTLALPKKDPVGTALKDLGITEDTQLTEIKELIVLIKASKDDKLSKDQEAKINKMEPVDTLAEKSGETAAPAAGVNIRKSYIEMVERRSVRKGALNMRIFLKFAELPVCQTQKIEPKEIEHCCAKIVVERQVKETQEAQRKKQYGRDRDDRKDNRRNRRDDDKGEGGGNNNFERGVAQPIGRGQGGGGGGWLKEDNQERAELRKKAQEMRSKINAPKNVIQKIKLIMNRITPDNYERNKKELKNYLFGEQFKTQDECFEEDIKFDEKVHVMQPENVNDELLDTIVSNIFRKAQMEKEYIIFYGQLCEALIRNELQLRGFESKVSNMAQSNFRKCLFDHCKTTFEKFFDKEEKSKHTKVLARTVDKSKMTIDERAVYNDELEKAVIFQTKLFGNNEFVGELYRRKLLPEKTLFYVFESLLGFSDLNDDVDDLVIEGAITLMDKIGPVLDENIQKANKSKKPEKQENLDKVFNRFKLLMDDSKDKAPQNLITNRVKLLIKNMFANRESGWQRTKDLNKAGPKTKAQVHEEMEEKQQREREMREGGHGGDRRQDRYTGNDRDRNDRDRRDGRGGQRDRRDTKQKEPEKKYQAKAQTKEPAQGKKKAEKSESPKIVVISDEDLGKALQSNFNDYINKTKQLEELDAEDEESKAAADDLQPSFELFNTLKKENGRSGDDIFANMLVQAFAEGDDEKVKKSLWSYLAAIKDAGYFKPEDFASGMSRFSGALPDVALDFPQVSEYTWKYVLQPLLQKEIINLKMLNWKAPEKPKDDDDDDIEFGTDPFFRLLAHLLKYCDAEGYDVKAAVVPPWKEIIKERHAKIEDADQLWKDIQDDVGEEAAALIRPLLDPA